MAHYAILGAGITGVTTAYALHARGYDVTVYDRHRYPAMETSFANGGQLSASNSETWTQWSTVLKGLRWMLTADAPLSVSPVPSWHKLSWMAEFLAAIPRYRRNTVATARLAIAARTGLAEMAERAALDFDFSRAGILHFYKTRADFAHARKVTAMLAEGGLARRELSADEVRRIEPRLHGDILGGYWTESDSTGDIHKFTIGLARWLEGQGVRFRLGTEIGDVAAVAGGVRVGDALHDGIVVCAGVGSRAIARQLGDRVNVYPVKGYSITVNLDDPASRAAAPRVSLLDDKAKIVTSRLGDGRFRVAGTAEFNGTNRDIRADRVRPLVRWVEEHFPEVSTESCVPWAGLRQMMPDMMPRVGPGRRAGVYYNTGHGHLGWTLGAATAEAIATRIAADDPVRATAPAAPRKAA
ncbi:D-amino acid dehydrogenase small subunit [Oceanicola granulosus HTCC2516]|uniref:D-amino acid dehydrogenase small subunit n=1 Tax=Oceanicola granulosus (strain ATCC BAA-861 / DSM 15982 / KCTC 12143 / HTCC2516) TaxID=314256 RepID=Q2CAC3_OCEGH|nr:D-amino acid dehydrogenase [Oceanicola granulosus]EAR49619.1 D-amino acid dehydrogenase small subunit [Oceanicola granulosus HTCC2516]